MSQYEFFPHTADVGIRATTGTLEGLFISLAQGVMELVAEDSRILPHESRTIALAADGVDDLLWKWLDELLFLFSTERFIPAEYQLTQLTQTQLRGRVSGETFDPKRHCQGREVKAVTRHQLKVEQRDDGWYGQVIVDI